jgi:lysyl-tRNA synthetase class 2
MSDWRPGVDRAVLEARAALFAQLREFFSERGVLEVDTPLLGRYAVTDPAIEPLAVERAVLSPDPLYLQTSPEFAMKRLLAAGSGPIYQLGKVFRDGELGSRHNPEFTMLEWYRPGFDLAALMEEVAELVQRCLPGALPVTVRRYGDLFREVLGVDAHRASRRELAAVARDRGDFGNLDFDRDGWLDLLMTHVVEPTLRDMGLVFVHDYPASQAALADIAERDAVAVAERFELYAQGLELANGYFELRDPRELERRAAADNARRRAAGRMNRELDPRLVAAMDAGLPLCSGVALGVDRLLMLRLGASSLREVLPFDWSRS